MIEKRHNITSNQMIIFIISAQIGIGILTLPSELAKETGHDGWISVLLTGFASILLGLLIILLLRKFKDKSTFEINQLLFGNYLGFIFNVLIIAYLLFAAALGNRVFNDFIRTTLLPTTPTLVLASFILLPSMYLIWYGLKPLCRYHNVIIFILLVALIYILMVKDQIRPSFLLPLGESGFGSIVSSMKPSFFAFLGFELVAIFYPDITDKNNIIKSHIAANSISLIFFTIIVASTTAIFGQNMLKILTIPIFSVARIFNAPIIERMDLYFTTLWFIAVACSLRSYMFCAWYSINKVFKIDYNNPLAFFLFIVTVMMLSRIPGDINTVFRYIEWVNLSGLLFICFLILCLIFTFITKRGVKSK